MWDQLVLLVLLPVQRKSPQRYHHLHPPTRDESLGQVMPWTGQSYPRPCLTQHRTSSSLSASRQLGVVQNLQSRVLLQASLGARAEPTQGATSLLCDHARTGAQQVSRDQIQSLLGAKGCAGSHEGGEEFARGLGRGDM